MTSLVRRAAAALVVAAGAVLVVTTSHGSTPTGWLVLDAVVGLALGLAAVVSGGPLVPRVLLGLASLAWSSATLWPALLWHQGLLLAALLLLLPAGVRSGPARVAALAGALAVGTGWGGQALAALVALVSAVAVVAEDTRSRRATPRTWYAAAAALAMAAVWGLSWAGQRWFPDDFDPLASFAAYAAVLLALAAGFVVVDQAERRSRGRRLARALDAYDPAAPDPSRLLEAVLGEALGDDGLVLAVGVDLAVRPGEGADLLVVTDPETGRRRAAVASRSPALDDIEVRRRVVEVLELVATDVELTERRRERVRELEAARRRLLRVTDEERGRVMELLGVEVVPRLRTALHHLDELGCHSSELTPVREDLRRMEGALATLVAGHPPAGLGDGALPDAVREVVARLPLDVTVRVLGDPRGSNAAETALFYACCEGLTNVVRHAAAEHATVCLASEPDDLVLRVEDDGRGGVDPAGNGLRGLADRMASLGGELSVAMGPGGGTVLVARVNRSASTVPQ